MTSPGSLSWNFHGNDQLSALLEKLDKTLTSVGKKLDDVGEAGKRAGAGIGSAEVPTKRLTNAAREAEERLESLRSKLGSVGRFAVSWGTIFAGAMAVAGGAAVKLGLETASANEQAAISFELLLGNAKDAAKFLAQLQAFAAATPFDMPGLRDAASRLLAVGVASSHVIPLLTALGDATAGMGTGSEGIGRAVTALTQMQMKTKVSAEEMLQLTEAGIPAWQALAAVLNTDVQTAMKKVSDREVDASKVFEAIEKKAGPSMQRLSGMMSRQSTTLSGIWSTFKDNTSQALAKFAEPMLPSLKKIIDWASTAIPKVLDTLLDGGKRIKEIFKDSDLPDNLLAAWDKFSSNTLPYLKDAWNDLFQTVSDNKEGLEEFGRLLVKAAPYIGDFVSKGLGTMVDVLSAVIVVIAHVVDAIQFMADEFLNAAKTIIDASVFLYGWVPGLGDKLKEAQKGFDEFASHVRTELAKLDGKTVTIKVATELYGSKHAAIQAANGEYISGRAAGGPVWPGQVYTWREQGDERLMVGSSGMYVQNNQDMRSARNGGGSGDVIGVLRIVHETPSGQVLREELLELKRQRGMASLGF